MASEAWLTLQQSYREVGQLYADLQPPVFARQEWGGTVYARNSLGDDVQVEVAYLAEHFLLAWNDWRGLKDRYLRYFGQPEEKLPKAWQKFGARCQTLAYQIGRDSRLDQIISHGWQTTTSATRLAGRKDVSARSIFHDLVMNHRRLMLVVILEPREEDADELPKAARARGKPWHEAPGVAWRLNQDLVREWDDVSRTVRSDTLWLLRNYQRTTLAVSWLQDETSQLARYTRSAFVHALTSEKHVSPSIEHFQVQLNIEAEDRQVVVELLRRIESAIAELGYDNFVDDVSSSEFLGGRDSPIGAGRVNVIPGHPRPICCTTLLAVSRGEKKAIGFPNVMKQVREHLIECVGRTKVAIIMCDHWRPTMLDDHIGDLRAHYRQGVRFLFLMVGAPGRVIAPVGVDLNLNP